MASGGGNDLRGGKNKYGPKTLMGSFVEDRADPSMGYTSSFSNHAYTTTTSTSLDDGLYQSAGASSSGIGAALDDADPERGATTNLIGYDDASGPSTWKPVSASMHSAGAGGPTEFSSNEHVGASHAMKNAHNVAEYRKRWTEEDPKFRGKRFESNMARSSNEAVQSGFKASFVRTLPGTPLAVEDLRNAILKRGGGDGIRNVARMFKIMDDSGDKKLTRMELKNGMMDYGVNISKDDLEVIFNFFDRDGSGKLDFDELLRGIKGSMNSRRVNLVFLAFQQLDVDGSGVIETDEVSSRYDTSQHPEVIAGRMSSAECIAQFMANWEQGECDGKVTFEEWVEYYRDISASIDEDDYFELMIRNAWHISGGEGWCANTTCRRVLVKHADGRQTVEEIENDLGLDEDQYAGYLAEKGIDAADVRCYDASEH